MPLTLQHAPHGPQIRRIFNALPPRVQSLPVTVREVEAHGWGATGARPGWWGVTSAAKDGCTIVLRQDRWAPHHALHEWMHVCMASVDGRAIGLVPVEAWGPWVEFAAAHRNGFPTAYGRNNGPAEAFAECGPELLGRAIPAGYSKLPKVIVARVKGMLGLT